MSMSARTANADRSGGIAKGESLLLTWNNDDDEHDYPSNDDDVIAMYCPANEANPRNFRDAATVAQARASTRKHLELHNKYRPDKNDELHKNDETITALTQRKLAGKMDGSWWISSFPIVREPNCDFRYWKRDGNVLQLAGTSAPAGEVSSCSSRVSPSASRSAARCSSADGCARAALSTSRRTARSCSSIESRSAWSRRRRPESVLCRPTPPPPTAPSEGGEPTGRFSELPSEGEPRLDVIIRNLRAVKRSGLISAVWDWKRGYEWKKKLDGK